MACLLIRVGGVRWIFYNVFYNILLHSESCYSFPSRRYTSAIALSA